MPTLNMNVRYPGSGKYWVALRDDAIEACAAMNGCVNFELADLSQGLMTGAVLDAIRRAEEANFSAYRLAARAALSSYGEVRSGRFSGLKFWMKTPSGEEAFDLAGPGMAPDFTGRVELRIEPMRPN